MLKKGFLLKVAAVGVISGISNFLFLRLINIIVQLVMEKKYTAVDVSYIILFTLALLVAIWSRRQLAIRVIYASQKIFWNFRNEILSIALNANYAEFRKRKNDIQSALIFDVGVLTQASLNLIVFFTSAVTTIACLVYMAILSFPLFLLTLGVSAAGILVYQVSTIKNNAQFAKTREYENRFTFYFNAIMNGFKEIKINRDNGDRILTDKIQPIANKSYKNNTTAFVGCLNNQTIGQVLFNVLIASILLVFSIRLNVDSTKTIKFLFVLLYLLAAIEAIMVLLPGLMQAKVSVNRLTSLRNDIVVENNGTDNTPMLRSEFKNIQLENILYQYMDAEKKVSFEIGPINFDIKKNDVIFVYGGNGSGKTTLVLTLLALLEPQKGQVKFNGQVVNNDNINKYKSLFSVVFNDFYLFDEFYSIRNLDVQKANSLISLFEIEDKVSIVDNHFSTIDLSTGQRKRLALITAILEEKNIIVMDEWAADQDPHFRRKFYREIIPELKKQGFTIIAITHDDAYYRYADKLYKMEYGQLIDESESMTHNPVMTNA
jgi:putative pyoverdin transport system ATP-binding/permease protein